MEDDTGWSASCAQDSMASEARLVWRKTQNAPYTRWELADRAGESVRSVRAVWKARPGTWVVQKPNPNRGKAFQANWLNIATKTTLSEAKARAVRSYEEERVG